MASPEVDSFWPSSQVESFSASFNVHIEEGSSSDNLDFLELPTTSTGHIHHIPNPPPLPLRSGTKKTIDIERVQSCCHVPKETKETWDKLFKEGHGADVCIITEGGSIIPAHYNLLSASSSVLRNFLLQAKIKNGIRYIKVIGIPFEAVYLFVRFLYSSCYEVDDMKKFVLHLMVLSHSYSIPSLKRVCIHHLEQHLLTNENVVDVLQLARECDAPRLSFICIRMIVRDFKTMASTEGWKAMKRANPALEQELLESVVEADSRKQERLKKLEEEKVYMQLHEAMEALVHICRDGCRTIGPRDKMLKGSQVLCSFPACKGIETLVRHFSICKPRVPGGCVHCKRMWQLLELHSRMCKEPDHCKVPLCRHFKEKMRQQSKKDEAKWKLLVSKVLAAKNALGLLSSRRSSFL